LYVVSAGNEKTKQVEKMPKIQLRNGVEIFI